MTTGETAIVLSPDRIIRWPLVVALGMPAALILCDAVFGPDFLYVVIGQPALLLLWCGAAIGALVAGVLSIHKRAWRRAALYFVLPAVVLIHALAPWSFIRFYDALGDRMHFQIMRPHYLAVVKSLPDIRQPKLAVFDWGGMSFASQGIVYDESDEITRPRQKQSPGWKARARNTELSCGYGATPMGGHFYFAQFPC